MSAIGNEEAATCDPFPLELQFWLSPAFPVGSFAYSHGLEWAVGQGRVRDRASAEAWIGDLLRHGSARNDAILLAAAWSAARDGDVAGIMVHNDLALALSGSRERYLETSTQGAAFVTTVAAAWPGRIPGDIAGALTGALAYPVAVGAVAGGAAMPLGSTTQAYLGAFTSNLVSALVRLAAIGQTDGQRVLASLAATIVSVASRAAASTPDDLGGAAFVSDLAAAAHETQETRMFRS
jgi:urease accessory protein